MANTFITTGATVFYIRSPYGGPMKGAIPAVLAAVLLSSLFAMPLVAAGPSGEAHGGVGTTDQMSAVQQAPSDPISVENTTNRLTLPNAGETERVEHGSDLGLGLASTDDALRIDHELYVLSDGAFDEANTTERREMAERAHERIQDRIDELEEREHEAVRSHANGERSTVELTQTLLRSYNEANELEAALDQLENRARRVSGYSLSRNELRADRAVLEAYQTQPRTNLAIATQNTQPGTEYEFALRTTENGYSIATIEDQTYLVETIRFDNRDTTQPDQFQEFESFYHSNELYPWASEATGDSPTFHDHSSERHFYWLEYVHDQGNLEVYLDAGTGNVYREIQKLSVDELPITAEDQWSEAGLEITLNETPADGPTEITVREASSGDPQRATISIDGVEIGETDGEDGTLWYVPPTDDYELGVETSTRAISPTIENDGVESEDG